MAAGPWTVAVGGHETTVAWDPPPDGSATTVYVCAHGAGGNMDDAAVRALSAALRPVGLGVVRFNFLYRAARSGRPDPMPRLLECYRTVLARVRTELAPARLVIGGRSMGGRAASMLAAEDAPPDGLLLMAYPLHPPGQPERLRDQHLPAISCPVLCFNGTRDPFCQPELMTAVLTRLGPNWQMHWLDGADHSFHVLKRSGRTDQAVLAEVAATTAGWLPRLRAT